MVVWLSIAASHAVPKQWLKTTTVLLYLTILWVRNSGRTPLSDSSISHGVLIVDIVLLEVDGDSWAYLGPDLSSVVASQWPRTPSVSHEQDNLHGLNDLVLKSQLHSLYFIGQSSQDLCPDLRQWGDMGHNSMCSLRGRPEIWAKYIYVIWEFSSCGSLLSVNSSHFPATVVPLIFFLWLQ